MLQYIITGIVIAAAVAYAIISIIKSFKSNSSSCNGCNGCAIKKNYNRRNVS